jgi:MFS family permease
VTFRYGSGISPRAYGRAPDPGSSPDSSYQAAASVARVTLGRDAPPGGLRRARAAVLAYFVLLGVTEGIWIARIPGVKAGLHLTDGLLGASLLVGPAGLVAVMPLAGRLSDQFGSARLSRSAAAAVAVMPLFLWTASTLTGVMLAVLAFGVAGGMLSVALNAQGVQVEQAYERPLMASFHASFSVGGLAGALLGGLLAWHQAGHVGDPQMYILAGVALGGMTLAVVAGCWLHREPDRCDLSWPAWRRVGSWAGGWISGARRARGVLAGGLAWRAWPRRAVRPAWGHSGSSRLTVLGLLALSCLIVEGAAASWSGVYLRYNLDAPRGYAAAGFAAFSLAMAVGRIAGDRLASRYGPACLVRGCGLLASAGLAAALCTRSPAGAVIGFAACGGGLSCTVPQFLSAAGHADPQRPGAGIAKVASLGYLGLVGGPVLIGGFASVAGLPAALCIPVALGLCVASFGAVVIQDRPAQEPAVPALDPARVSGTGPAQRAGSRSR